jgi:hypothetical protein
MINTVPSKKVMTPAQIAYLTGKRVDSTKWVIPDWYARCAVTGKMYPEEAFTTFSFPHMAFTDEQLKALGSWGVGWVEHADYLSEEGYEILMRRVDALGYQDLITQYWDNVMVRATAHNRRMQQRMIAAA